MTSHSLPKARFDDLLALLSADGYEVIGPRIDQGAIVYGPVNTIADLPVGWTDRQGPGWYRLERRTDEAVFGFAVGPHSWKKYLFPSELRLWSARRSESGFVVQEENHAPPRRAFIGVRSCELHALAIQDRVFLNREGEFTDPYYSAARSGLFLVAVECTEPGDTCFCTAMGTGPGVQTAKIPRLVPTGQPSNDAGRISLPTCPSPAPAAPVCDLVLTELDQDFVMRSTSDRGEAVLRRLALAPAPAEDIDLARQRVAAAAQRMRPTPDLSDVQGLLHRNPEHPRWDDVSQRCLACTNCTMVCPTCFCSSVADTTDLAVETVERERRWDSCFNPEFAAVHGGNHRPSIRGRYRQWLTHKFASWIDQFDVSGCVGCGRCITWCPVGIDVIEEIRAIGASDGLRSEVKP